MIRVLIVDDSPVILDGISAMLDAHHGFELVGAARDGLEAVQMAQRLNPDVVLMDAQMPFMDGAEATHRIKEMCGSVGVLFFTAFPQFLDDGVLADADGWLNKDCEPQDLFSAMQNIVWAMRAGNGKAMSRNHCPRLPCPPPSPNPLREKDAA